MTLTVIMRKACSIVRAINKPEGESRISCAMVFSLREAWLYEQTTIQDRLVIGPVFPKSELEGYPFLSKTLAPIVSFGDWRWCERQRKNFALRFWLFESSVD